jgi:hypothetical protein
VQVVRHDLEGVQFDAFGVIRNILPARLDDATDVAEMHLTVTDFAKEASPASSADGHEIRTRARVVVPGKPDRAAMMEGGVVGH